MTSKERWLAAMQLQPVDRLPFWPKLDGAYPRAQAAPFNGMSVEAIHAWIGSDPQHWGRGVLREVRTNTGFEVTTADGYQRKAYRTPYGDLTAANRWDDASQSWHPVEFPIKRREDLPVMAAWYADQQIEVDPDQVEVAQEYQRQIGENGVTGPAIGESPLMEFVEWLAGIENAHFLLADCPEEVEALFDAMHRVLLRKAELNAVHNPGDFLYMVENTSTTLISPAQYRQYCKPHLTAYGEILRAHDRLLVLHMCGHLKALLPDLAEVPAHAFEAFTTPTLGNTTLLDGRTHCPNVCLIGGTNAMLWTRPAAEIIAGIETELDSLPHRRGLIVTSAGVMPPLCKPETIRAVCEWVKGYPARV